jgi:hypothetical protein
MAEKSSWDQANIWQKLGLVWRNRRKLAKLERLLLLTILPLNYFMGRINEYGLFLCKFVFLSVCVLHTLSFALSLFLSLLLLPKRIFQRIAYVLLHGTIFSLRI